MIRPDRIISGGQTGADQAALFAARDIGIPTGGTAPKGWRTEDGPAPWLADFGLVEATTTGYTDRTGRNVWDSDATVIFGDASSPGSRLTVDRCRAAGKPFLIDPTPDDLVAAVVAFDIKVLNVAGNRASKNPGIGEHVRFVLIEAFGVA